MKKTAFILLFVLSAAALLSAITGGIWWLYLISALLFAGAGAAAFYEFKQKYSVFITVLCVLGSAVLCMGAVLGGALPLMLGMRDKAFGLFFVGLAVIAVELIILSCVIWLNLKKHYAKKNATTAAALEKTVDKPDIITSLGLICGVAFCLCAPVMAAWYFWLIGALFILGGIAMFVWHFIQRKAYFEKNGELCDGKNSCNLLAILSALSGVITSLAVFGALSALHDIIIL